MTNSNNEDIKEVADSSGLLGRYLDEDIFELRSISYHSDITPTLRYLDFVQRKNDVFGCVGEIGVAQGAFFVQLALCCRSTEIALAIDVFDNLRDNWNPVGGSSSLDLFKDIIASQLNGDVRVSYVLGDSMFLEKDRLLSEIGQQRFRLFSIDGAHSAGHTVNDLKLASEVIAPGGIVFLDDIQNWGWPGVIEGFARYMLLNDHHRLVPFFLYGNKLLLTTPGYHGFYLDKAIEIPRRRGLVTPNVDYRISNFFGYAVLGY
jgi:hypothetical protein